MQWLEILYLKYHDPSKSNSDIYDQSLGLWESWLWFEAFCCPYYWHAFLIHYHKITYRYGFLIAVAMYLMFSCLTLSKQRRFWWTWKHAQEKPFENNTERSNAQRLSALLKWWCDLFYAFQLTKLTLLLNNNTAFSSEAHTGLFWLIVLQLRWRFIRDFLQRLRSHTTVMSSCLLYSNFSCSQQIHSAVTRWDWAGSIKPYPKTGVCS